MTPEELEAPSLATETCPLGQMATNQDIDNFANKNRRSATN